MGKAKKKYLIRRVEAVDLFYRSVRAIDNLIKAGMAEVDILTCTAMITPYAYIFFACSRANEEESEKCLQGFFLLLRRWINWQRTMKREHLMSLYKDGAFDEVEDIEMLFQTKERIPPTLSDYLSPKKILDAGEEREKREENGEKQNQKSEIRKEEGEADRFAEMSRIADRVYSPLPDDATIRLIVGNHTEDISAILDGTGLPPQITYYHVTPKNKDNEATDIQTH